MSSRAVTSARRRALLVALVPDVMSVDTSPHGQMTLKRTTWRDYGGGPDNARYIGLIGSFQEPANR